MSTSTIGLFTGLIIGLAWMWGGFDDAIVVAFFGVIGWFVARLVERGDIDLGDYLGGGDRRRGRGTP